MTHRTQTTYQGGRAFETESEGKRTQFDDNPHNEVLSPKRAVLGALASCSGMDVVATLEKMRVAFSGFSIATDGDLTEDYPKYYHHIRMVFTICVAPADRDKVERAVHLSLSKYCGVHAMLSKAASIEHRIEFTSMEQG